MDLTPAGQDPGGAAAREGRLTVARSARYYTLGGGPETREVWYVLHGYGQLAAYFIRHCAPLQDARRLIVAPEALGRFYLDDPHRRVGASWMTREDRAHEIADYLNYLDALHEAVTAALPAAPRVHLLGFSQGAETACRWAALGRTPVDRLILWGGRLPPDLDLEARRHRLPPGGLTLVAGTADPYATPERIAEVEARLHRHAIPFRHLAFDGGHHLDPDLLRTLAAER